jgi:cytochrome c-type biogenesis protein CcmH
MLAGTILAAAEERALTRSESERYEKLTHELIAPCCWREPIAIHRSEEALQMLNEVEQLVLAGRSEQEIKAIYVARYGVRILADPPGKAGQWLYVVPFALLCGFFFLATLRLRSMVAGVAPPLPRAPAELMAQIRMETDSEWN